MIEMDPTTTKADGISYDDTTGMTTEAVALLAERRLVFETEFSADGQMYGGFIVARDVEAAMNVAFGRGLGEHVSGVVSDVVPGTSHWNYTLLDAETDD